MYNFHIRWMLIALFALTTLGCSPLVLIPAPEQDNKPVIHVSAIAAGGSGEVKVGDANPVSCASPCKNPVSAGTQLAMIIDAKNPGGVKHLSAVIGETGKLSYGVQTESRPDAQNRVPTQLSILGHDNAGGVGNTVIGTTMNNPTGTFTVLTSAENYNGMTSLYAVTYFVSGHVHASFVASPASIYRGDTATLTWNTTNASSVNIEPLGTQPRSGSKSVTPDATTTYTLTAADWLESTSRSVTVNVTERPVKGCLNGSLHFLWDPGRYGGTGDITVGVRFHGTLTSAPEPGSTAAMVFTKTETPTQSNYGGYKGITFQACGLMPGTWSTSAEVISGPLLHRTIPCTAIVPGSVSFDYDSLGCGQ